MRAFFSPLEQRSTPFLSPWTWRSTGIWSLRFLRVGLIAKLPRDQHGRPCTVLGLALEGCARSLWLAQTFVQPLRSVGRQGGAGGRARPRSPRRGPPAEIPLAGTYVKALHASLPDQHGPCPERRLGPALGPPADRRSGSGLSRYGAAAPARAAWCLSGRRPSLRHRQHPSPNRCRGSPETSRQK